jgi:hypothetical protein
MCIICDTPLNGVAAGRRSSNCAAVRGPRVGAVTPSVPKSHAMATCGIVVPCALAISAAACTTLKLRSMHGNAGRATERQQLELDGSLNQRVLRLHAHERGPALAVPFTVGANGNDAAPGCGAR